MSEAETLFTRAAQTSWNRFSEIIGFREVARLGTATAARGSYIQFAQFIHELYTSPEHEEMFIDKAGAIEALKPIGGLEGFAKMMAENQIKKFQQSVDAASLVFAHSVLDGVALDYCRVTTLVSPASWEPFLEKRQVTLHDVKETKYEDILKGKIEEHLKALDFEPLMKKLERLFQVCKPDASFDPIKDYKYDPDRLAKLDQNRHDVVHKQMLENPLPQGNEDIWFLLCTANYLMGLVNMRFNVKMDLTVFSPGYNPQATSAG